jgi:hypothetical protein
MAQLLLTSTPALAGGALPGIGVLSVVVLGILNMTILYSTFASTSKRSFAKHQQLQLQMEFPSLQSLLYILRNDKRDGVV